MRYYDLAGTAQLTEGVRFGKKELNATLNDIDDFVMGVEYEVLANNHDHRSSQTDIEYMQELLDFYKIGNIFNVVSEHDNMTEVITTRMGIVDGLAHIKKFFTMANDAGMGFPEHAGMHVSISTKSNADNVNLVKFMVLMAGGYLNRLFPEREHTNNAYTAIVSSLKELHKKSSKISINDMERWLLSDSEIMQEKYTAINFKGYAEYDGRIEMRFFGGANYGDRYDEIRWNIVRACFLLGVSYGDIYENEYRTALVKMYNKASETNSPDLASLFINSVNHDNAVSSHTVGLHVQPLVDQPSKLKLNLHKISREFHRARNHLATEFFAGLLRLAGHLKPVVDFTRNHIDYPGINTSDLGMFYQIVRRNESLEHYTEIFKKQYTKLVLQGDDTVKLLDNAFGAIPEIVDAKTSGRLEDAFIYAFSHTDEESVMSSLVTRMNKEGFQVDDKVGALINRVATMYKSLSPSSSGAMLTYLVNNISNEYLGTLVGIISNRSEPTLHILYGIKDKIQAALPTDAYADFLVKLIVYLFGSMGNNDAEESQTYYDDSEEIMKEIINLTEAPTPFDQFIIQDKFNLFIRLGIDIDPMIRQRFDAAQS